MPYSPYGFDPLAGLDVPYIQRAQQALGRARARMPMRPQQQMGWPYNEKGPPRPLYPGPAVNSYGGPRRPPVSLYPGPAVDSYAPYGGANANPYPAKGGYPGLPQPPRRPPVSPLSPQIQRAQQELGRGPVSPLLPQKPTPQPPIIIDRFPNRDR